jgi:hypothetical protein
VSTHLIEKKRNPVTTGFEMRPTNLTEATEFAHIISSSDICPKDHKGKPGNVLVAIQMGSEVGLPPLQALNSIAVINGKPTIWGDAALALVMQHPHYEWHDEKIEQDATSGNHRAYCTVKRKGNEPYTYSFSVEDAKKAGLWSKGGNWSSYPKRMLQMRARGFALRDKFPDALKGLSIREEVLDYEEVQESEDVAVVRKRSRGNYKSKSDMLADMIGENKVIEAEITDLMEAIQNEPLPEEIEDEPKEEGEPIQKAS